MGIKDLRMLGFHDKTLEFEDVDFVADKIEAIIQEVNPSRIITFYPEHGVHPDHDAFGRAVVRAVSRMSKEERPVIHAVAITKNREAVLGEPDVVNNISEVFEHKLAALGAHRSQTEAMLEETHAKIKNKDAATLKWLQLEQFWTYNGSRLEGNLLVVYIEKAPSLVTVLFVLLTILASSLSKDRTALATFLLE